MQNIKVLYNQFLSANTKDVISGETVQQENFELANDYYVYKNSIGGGIVNANNVRNFLDKEENENLANTFVTYLQDKLNFTEFKEIFYDNKKLSSVFNEFYNNKVVPGQKNNTSIQEALKDTLIKNYQNTNFKSENSRIASPQSHINQIYFSADSYFINIKIEKDSSASLQGDFSEYFEDCFCGVTNYKEYSFINNIEKNKKYVNIPFLLKLKNNTQSVYSNFGYSPVNDLNFNEISTPLNIKQNNTTFDYQFIDFNQFANFINYEPKSLQSHKPGIAISQNKVNIDKNNEFEASFKPNAIKEFDINKQETIKLPITVELKKEPSGQSKFYIQYERYSSAFLGTDFLMKESSNTNQLDYNFIDDSLSLTKNIIINKTISPEDTIVLSLRNQSNKILDFVIIRCEEFVEFEENINNSYILLENKKLDRIFLNCFVDYNYDNNDLELYRNSNIQLVFNTKDNAIEAPNNNLS